MASTLSNCGDSDRARDVLEKASIKGDRVGSDKYQQNHMAQIFQQGLSFSGFERNKTFIARPDGTYVDLSDVSGADTDGDCRAAIATDFDDDGDVDLFVNAIQRECHYLYRNDAIAAAETPFLKIRLVGTKGHAGAIGAIVKLKVAGQTQVRVLSCGSGFESQDAPEMVFGLGANTSARVSVRWPGRDVEEFGVLKARGRYVLREGAGVGETFAGRPFVFAEPRPPGVRIDVGATLPKLTVDDMSGKSLSFEADGDRRTLVNFWATTCTSCVAEMGDLGRLAEKGRLDVVTISLDLDDRVGIMREIMAKTPKIRAFRAKDGAVETLFDLTRLAIPVSFIIDKDGKIERVIQGKVDIEKL